MVGYVGHLNGMWFLPWRYTQETNMNTNSLISLISHLLVYISAIAAYPCCLTKCKNCTLWGSSVQSLVVSDSLQPHELQHARPPCPSSISGGCLNSCPLSRWWHPTVSSSVIHFSSCLQSFPPWGSFPIRQFFASDGQSIGISALATVLPVNIQDWFPLGWTGLISLQSKGLSMDHIITLIYLFEELLSN